MWDSLYNIVLLLFWSRLWLTDDQEMVVNRYLAAYGRLQQRAIDFLQPVLPFMGPRSIAMMSLVVLIVFRGLAVPNDAEWRLSFGFIIGQTQASSIPSRIVFSTLSFALFLFKIWGISLVYVWHRQQVTFRSTIDALYQLARPFTDVPLAWRPVLLLGFGGGLAFALTWIGGASLVPGTGLIHVPQLLTISLMAWVHLLPIIQQVLFLVIIGSFAGGFMGAPALTSFCRDWIDMLIGPMRGFPIRIGMMDLTALVFMFALGYVHYGLSLFLADVFQKLA